MTGRFTGFFDLPPKALSAFGEESALMMERAGLRSRVLRVPSDRPLLTLVMEDSAQSSLHHFLAHDGSMCFVAGEVFNLRSLAQAAPPALDAGPNPAAAIFAFYKRFGASGFGRVDAAAAFVIWDQPTQSLHLVRDRVGASALYHSTLGNGLLFSNVQTDLLLTGVPRAIDLAGVECFLAKGFTGAPVSFIESIRKTPPGHCVRQKLGQLPVVSRYFLQSGRPKIHPTKEERRQSVTDLVKAAIAQRVEGVEGKLGVLLSSGVDSAFITAASVKLLGLQPETFTFEYRDYDGALNEHTLAQRLSQHLGLKHSVVPVTPQDLMERLPQAIRAFGKPISFGIHSFRLDAAMESGCKTFLTGSGVDAVGISDHGYAWSRFRQLPPGMRQALIGSMGLTRFAGQRVATAIEKIVWAEKNNIPAVLAASIASEPVRSTLYAQPAEMAVARSSMHRLVAAQFEDYAAEDPFDQWRLMGQRFFTAECLLQWHAGWSRAYGASVRHPFLSNDFQDYVIRQVNHSRGKAWFREVAAQFMPREFAFVPKVHQALPLTSWLRGPMREFVVSHLTETSIAKLGLFRPEAVVRLRDQHLSGAADHTWTVWCLLTLKIWHETLFAAPFQAHASPRGGDAAMRLIQS